MQVRLSGVPALYEVVMGVEVMVTVGGGTMEKNYVLYIDLPIVHTLNNDICHASGCRVERIAECRHADVLSSMRGAKRVKSKTTT